MSENTEINETQEREEITLDSPQECESQADSQTCEADSQTDVESSAVDYEAQYNELKDQYVRAFADFENTKKRLERDKNQSLEYANERVMSDLLPVLDTLDKALESARANPQAEAIAQGLELTLESFLKVLSKHGVEMIETSGEFDPNLHECLMQVPSEEKSDGAILQTLQKGFVYKQRVLRPAMVSVVKNQS